jgi:hypothetical protein
MSSSYKPGYYSISPEDNPEGYETDVASYTVTEHESVAFIMRCQTVTKWNYKKKRTEVRNRARAQRTGACACIQSSQTCSVMLMVINNTS